MNILFVGLSGVPKRSRACDIRLTFFANMLAKKNDVTILNRYAPKQSLRIKETQLSDNVDVIELIESQKTGKLITLLLYMLSVLYEPVKIAKLSIKKKVDVIHVYSGHYLDYLFYYIIGKLVGAKVIYQYVEYRTAFKPRGLYHKLNSRMCDRYGMRLFDGVLPISNYLEEKCRETAPNTPTLKVPPICDFNLFEKNNTPINQEQQYLLFCASADYMEVIEFVVESYRKSSISRDTDLVLVLSGNKDRIRKLHREWKDCTILSQLPYDELIAYFKYAYALFIPLRPIISDIARFPNKVCEYLASEGVIITTNVGEMAYYFRDGENAVVAKDYSQESMVACLDRLAHGEYDYEAIRTEGYAIGKRLFNMESYEQQIHTFLEKL